MELSNFVRNTETNKKGIEQNTGIKQKKNKKLY